MEHQTLEQMAREEGFSRVYFLPLFLPQRWLETVKQRGQTDFVYNLRPDPRRRYAFAKSLMLLAYAYPPFPAGEQVPSFYLGWRQGQEATRRLTQRMVLAGAKAQQASDLPMRALALESGIGHQGRNGLLYLDGLGSRFALFMIATDAAEPQAIGPQKQWDCGSCRKCVDACPAGAIHMDRGLVIRQCMRAHMGDTPFDPWVEREMQSYVGCEICQQVCPHNAALSAGEPTQQQRELFSPQVLNRGLADDAQDQLSWRFSHGKLPYQAGVFRRRDRMPPFEEPWLHMPEEAMSQPASHKGEMFCFQCEQTSHCSGCTGKAGACGKTADTAQEQDRLTGSLIALALALNGASPSDPVHEDVLNGLFMGITNVNFDPQILSSFTDRIQQHTRSLEGELLCYDMDKIWSADEDIRSAKSMTLFGLRGMAAYAHHALVLGYEDRTVRAFFYDALRQLGQDLPLDTLLNLSLELGHVNYKCMELLDRANSDTYGTPTPTQVSMQIERGPFIVITGHDLRDLELLLKQTRGTGVNVYTHGEMLPAHAYARFKKYPHLKGNFGTAWQNQRKEFDAIPAPILYTTNCLMPPAESYRDRVFTTGPVYFPGTPHIGSEKDFWPVIRRALELGGYAEDHLTRGENGGIQVTTGFGHRTVRGAAGTVLGGLRSGAIRHIFLVAGCDGAKSERSYYTDFVKLAPRDTFILTLACGKYRFNDLDVGSIAGLPRILDMGQCNDAYSAISVANTLAEAMHCRIRDLPISYVLSWYEQKAVCILLTLLYLGFRDIRLGPEMPAFFSPNVEKLLRDRFGLRPITDPVKDLTDMIGVLHPRF